MAEPKRKPNDKDLKEIIAAIENEDLRRDCKTLRKLTEEYSREKPVIWGDEITGFDTRNYEYSAAKKGTGFQM